MFRNSSKNKYNKGTTLIELIVVIFIFVLMSSIAVFNYGKFRSSLSIQNLADDIALAMRRTQGYAIGVRGAGGGFSAGYGIHFTAKPSGASYKGSSKSFVLFADINGNLEYDNKSDTCGNPVSGNECLELLSVTSADSINLIYLNNSNIPISPSSTIDISFKRPNPEPTFCYRVNGSGPCHKKDISNVKVKISSDGNSSINKVITIYNTGQISVGGGI
jgi:prepilin-type N-terminal cleavage/methylation domain-containing protein